MQTFIFTFCLICSVLAQFDELSILQEVLDRTTQDPSRVAESTKLPASGPNAAKILKPDENIEEGSGVEVEKEGPLVVVTSTEASKTTTEPIDTVLTGSGSGTSTISPVPAITPSTQVWVTTTSDPMDTLFGFKGPDLATIYRRLFPFNDQRVMRRPTYRRLRP
ncbi:hypothetical protein WR25_26961 [Diploscapter pachys]|uniref:Uncharacterized protein n=1 Tax=Diploscapter pachys TaxID=2018661 RepID=A0A2A2JLY3_9BILA|nr:hypothetical protein WR25_26961 [Diploscapter pachys]